MRKIATTGLVLLLLFLLAGVAMATPAQEEERGTIRGGVYEDVNGDGRCLNISLEGKKPKIKSSIEKMRKNIARVMGLDVSQVGVTATSGEGLTDFGCGDGMQCFAIITTME